MIFEEKNIFKKDSITVEFFFKNVKERFNFTLLNEKPFGFEKVIREQSLNRPQFALTGFMDHFTESRIQVFGNTELKYLSLLDSNQRKESLEKIFERNIPCVILTESNQPFQEMIDLSQKYNIPLFGSTYPTTKLIYLIGDFLDDQFASRLSAHGSFVDVYGVGVLFVGRSGIGKSEVALDLVERGHRLVADDVVIFTKKGEGILIGSGTQLVQHFMEVRGIGLIDIRSIFGVRSIRYQKRLEVVIDLEIWDEDATYTRTGLDENLINICGVEIPQVKVPIVPGKNITVISEVIALNYLQKHYGEDAAKIFKERLDKKLQEKSSNNDRSIDYFEHDFE
ncbi:MAG: HPr(Ser) kinase/phosphatase [Bacteroidetes bacterium]|nr:HPr(Ser) kinase/phosphatase [Bacteroidota bacterium]